MSLTILLEIGHDASLRSKTTSEGFTHDWEVFVKGQNGADIHYYVEKVVFYLHETFPNPKRVVKEPPFSLRTSGYAGFKLPIEIHLKNNQEPKRIKFNYDLDLQPTGPPIHIVQKEKYTFFNPSEEFRSKLLKGGAVEGGGSNHENSTNRGTSIEKNQMTSKPKLGGSDIPKKHKMKLEETRTTDFENLFGPPIKKTTKIPDVPKPKEPPPIKPPNADKSIDKEKNDKTKSNKSTHKDKEKPKEKSDNLDKKNKEERKKFKDEKSKDRERSKEKSSKKEREKSPAVKPRSPTPKRSPKREPSPVPVQKHSSSKEKETSKEEKKDNKDRDRDKKEEKKSKKDKRDHKEGKHKDRDKDHRDHKNKESKPREKEPNVIKQKETSPVPPPTVLTPNTHKTDKKPKEKEQIKEQPKEEEKIEKQEKVEKVRNESEDRQKHKHKKKERKEKKEEKHSKKEEKKIEKTPNSITNSKDVQAKEEKPIPAPPSRQVDKNNLFGSPKSDSPSTPKESEVKVENNTTFVREDESSNDSVKLSSKEASPAPRVPSKSPSPLPPPEPVKKPEPEKKKEPSPKKKEKKEKKKDKKIDKEKDEKRKKRKSDPTTTMEEEPLEKISKIEDVVVNSDEESKVSSTEDATQAVVPPKSECDMDMLRDLQRKIMSLKDNADLQRVVQLIAETGQYEVSAHTFDFDLCLLDRSTVRQLQDFFSTISS